MICESLQVQEEFLSEYEFIILEFICQVIDTLCGFYSGKLCFFILGYLGNRISLKATIYSIFQETLNKLLISNFSLPVSQRGASQLFNNFNRKKVQHWSCLYQDWAYPHLVWERLHLADQYYQKWTIISLPRSSSSAPNQNDNNTELQRIFWNE